MKRFTFVARLVLLSVFLIPALSGMSQQTVKFEEIGFEEAMAKAKKENKIIFVDVNRGVPTKFDEQVAQEIFPTDSVAKFFNEHCIAIKMNMQSEEGKKFAPRLAMLMYPAYVFYASTGDQLEYTNAGIVAKTPAVLMEKARASLRVAQEKMVNTRSIQFTKAKWSELLARAKKENKMIFLDAHTEWCRPCILMRKNVFTLNNVADFYNKNFINTEMDMEKGEGPELAKRYAIRAYPTFLFIDGDGNLISRDGGYQEAEEFIKAGQTALDKKSASGQTTGFVSPVSLVKPGGNGKAAETSAAPAEKPSAIHFSTSSWSEMLAEAKKSGKLIFMDAYTTWCGPCKVMRATVFTEPEVGNFYNRNFVNAYIDMEKGEGIELRQKYEVRAYPTYLFINGDGEVVHRVVGSCPKEIFIQHGLDALSPKNNLLALTNAYPKAAQDPEFIRNYLKALGNSYDKEKANLVASNYLQGIHPSRWIEHENYKLIHGYIEDASSPVFMDFLRNREKFRERYGEKEVDDYIQNTLQNWPRHYLSFPKDGTPQFDRTAFERFLSDLKNTGYERADEMTNKAWATVSLSTKDWKQYSTSVNQMIEANQIGTGAAGASQLYSYALNANRFSEDKETLKQARNWVEGLVNNSAELNPMMKAQAMNLYAELLEKTGDKKKAAAVKKQISKENLNAAQKSNPMQPLRVKTQ